MGKEERRAARAAKKAARKERKVQGKRLIQAIKNAKITFKPDGDADLKFVDVFKEVWEVLDPALKYAIAMEKTDAATDKVLGEVWDAGNAIANGGGASAESEFLTKFKEIWSKVEKALEIIQLLAGDKVDATIDDILEAGDWIADGAKD